MEKSQRWILWDTISHKKKRTVLTITSYIFVRILPIAQNEDGLATVLGHEIAHQLARHSAEKLSFTKIALFVGTIVAVVFDPSYTAQRVLMELGMMVRFFCLLSIMALHVFSEIAGTNISQYFER